MKSVSASSGCSVVKRHLQIVLPEKPTKDAPGFIQPLLLVCYTVGENTRRDGGAGLYGLLIETRLITAGDEEPS